MNPLTAHQLATILGASVAAGCGDVVASGGVSTDTRTLHPQSVFFALRGENFIGDKFAAQALAEGAAIAVVQQWQGDLPPGTAVIVVPDALFALQQLAKWWRSQLDIPVVCITGSNGKTSTKDFTAAVLGRKFHVSATRGNLNNHIGLPLTVLATTTGHTAAVWEIGMNHPGEIAPLCAIARPTLGIITNVGTAHIEFMGSREKIAEEKGMLGRALPVGGTLFLPADCDFLEQLRHQTAAMVVPVGGDRGQVRAENIHTGAAVASFSLAIDGHQPVAASLPVAGRHMVTNALLAAAVGWKLGISPADIAAGLADAELTAGRLGSYEFRGATIIDDTYNANPESMAAAIETLADTPVKDGARRFIVLGRMGELGTHAETAHLRVGALAAERGLTVVAVGDGSEGIARGADSTHHFPELPQAASWLSREVKPGDVVLLKGSRSAGVERVMHAAFPQT